MLENFSYSPTLYTRAAETKALLNLPSATKDQIFPILIARPWPNAKALDKLWERLRDAFNDRPFALDIDPFKRGASSNQAGRVFDTLFDSARGHENYFNAVNELSFAVPVLQAVNGELPDFIRQLRHVERIDRGVILRITPDLIAPARVLTDVLEAYPECVVDIDCGWSRDLLGQETWASPLVSRLVDVAPDTEVVISGSSFPDAFAKKGARSVAPVVEREVFNSLVRRHNAANLTYGDWGSTRPPSPPMPMTIVPRIDLPASASWTSFRQDKAVVENYEAIAQRAMADREWPHGLAIWGTYAISNTANGLPGGIRSPSAATAARVNIHLHRQAHFGSNFEISDVDEPFED